MGEWLIRRIHKSDHREQAPRRAHARRISLSPRRERGRGSSGVLSQRAAQVVRAGCPQGRSPTGFAVLIVKLLALQCATLCSTRRIKLERRSGLDRWQVWFFSKGRTGCSILLPTPDHPCCLAAHKLSGRLGTVSRCKHSTKHWQLVGDQTLGPSTLRRDWSLAAGTSTVGTYRNTRGQPGRGLDRTSPVVTRME